MKWLCHLSTTSCSSVESHLKPPEANRHVHTTYSLQKWRGSLWSEPTPVGFELARFCQLARANEHVHASSGNANWHTAAQCGRTLTSVQRKTYPTATLPHLKSHTNCPDTKPRPNSVVVSQKWVTQHCLQPSTRHSSLVVATQTCLSLRPVHSSRRQQSLVITRIWNATDGTILYWTLEQEACSSDGSCQYPVTWNFFYRRQWAWSARRRYIWYATDNAVAGCLAEPPRM
jgi:hypothetical protein